MAALKAGKDKGKSGVKVWLKRAFLLAAAAAIAAWYSSLDPSKKRFIKHILKQVPYMPARYFA